MIIPVSSNSVGVYIIQFHLILTLISCAINAMHQCNRNRMMSSVHWEHFNQVLSVPSAILYTTDLPYLFMDGCINGLKATSNLHAYKYLHKSDYTVCCICLLRHHLVRTGALWLIAMYNVPKPKHHYFSLSLFSSLVLYCCVVVKTICFYFNIYDYIMNYRNLSVNEWPHRTTRLCFLPDNKSRE